MNEAIEEISKAAEGLWYISETEAPFSPIILKGIRVSEELLSMHPGKEIEEVSLDWFFRNMVKFYPADPPSEKMRAERFLALKKLLEEKLQEITVYRVGKTQVDAFILGKLPDGKIGGLKTHLVET